jgi:hypothetical protein
VSGIALQDPLVVRQRGVVPACLLQRVAEAVQRLDMARFDRDRLPCYAVRPPD